MGLDRQTVGAHPEIEGKRGEEAELMSLTQSQTRSQRPRVRDDGGGG